MDTQDRAFDWLAQRLEQLATDALHNEQPIRECLRSVEPPQLRELGKLCLLAAGAEEGERLFTRDDSERRTQPVNDLLLAHFDNPFEPILKDFPVVAAEA